MKHATQTQQRTHLAGIAGLALACGALYGCNSGATGTEAETGNAQTAAAAESCETCGTVASIEPVKVKGHSSGKGAVAGAIIGGVIGHQFGSGSGNDAATAGGAIGGAIAGNEAEKEYNSYNVYNMRIALDNGGQRTVQVESAEGFSVGDSVKVVGERVVHA